MLRVTKERDGAIVGGLTFLLILLWLGFFVHRAPRFAGSVPGQVLGIAGALLMLVPLAYVIVKRVPLLKRAVTRHVPMRTLLAWHIYAGVLGPVLVLIHTGHHFHSPLGIALTAMTITVALSGYVGRSLMKGVGEDLRTKKSLLSEAQHAFESLSESSTSATPTALAIAQPMGLLRRLRAAFFDDAAMHPSPESQYAQRSMRIAALQADLEYAVRIQEGVKRVFGRWLKVHIAISFVLYALLALHVWSSIHFGLRWLS
jgi:hypothetical protein